jgi:hypothetical protein
MIVNRYGGQEVTDEDQTELQEGERADRVQVQDTGQRDHRARIDGPGIRVRGVEEVGGQMPELRQLRHGLPDLLLLRRGRRGRYDFHHGHEAPHLYSCNLLDFAAVAGGHNFRPEPHMSD